MGISKFATRCKELSNPNGKVVMVVVIVLAAAAAAELEVVLVVIVIVVASAAAVLTGIVPNKIMESGFSKHLNLLIFAICVFVLHRRYTNIPCTVAPDGLLSVATHLVTGSGLLQH